MQMDLDDLDDLSAENIRCSMSAAAMLWKKGIRC